MDLTQLFDVVASVGGLGGVLALVVLYFARQDAQQHKQQWMEQSKFQNEIAKDLLTVVKDNTQAHTVAASTNSEVKGAVVELRQEVSAMRAERLNGHARPPT